MHPLHPPCVRAWSCLSQLGFDGHVLNDGEGALFWDLEVGRHSVLPHDVAELPNKVCQSLSKKLYHLSVRRSVAHYRATHDENLSTVLFSLLLGSCKAVRHVLRVFSAVFSSVSSICTVIF